MSSADSHAEYHRRISQVRQHLELSQEKMAERLGVSLRGYANYERGERAIPIDLLRALYDKYSVDPIWLLTGEGAMILDRDVRYRLDQRVLDNVLVAVERIERRLEKPMAIRKKARLIGLLYEESQLLSESGDEVFRDSRLHGLMK